MNLCMGIYFDDVLVSIKIEDMNCLGMKCPPAQTVTWYQIGSRVDPSHLNIEFLKTSNDKNVTKMSYNQKYEKTLHNALVPFLT